MLTAMGVDLLVLNNASEAQKADTSPSSAQGAKVDIQSLRQKVGLAESEPSSSVPTQSANDKAQTASTESPSEPQTISLNNAIAVLFAPATSLEKDLITAIELAGVSMKLLPDLTPDDINRKFRDVALVLCRSEKPVQPSGHPIFQVQGSMAAENKKRLWRTIQSLTQ